jgi:hypothetical protein
MPYNIFINTRESPVTLPSYSVLSFSTKEHHIAALYDACLLIVNTYNQTDMLDFYEHNGVSPYAFMTFARNILNRTAAGN